MCCQSLSRPRCGHLIVAGASQCAVSSSCVIGHLVMYWQKCSAILIKLAVAFPVVELAIADSADALIVVFPLFGETLDSCFAAVPMFGAQPVSQFVLKACNLPAASQRSGEVLFAFNEFPFENLFAVVLFHLTSGP